MEQRGKNDFSDVAVENAIQDLKKIPLKKFDNETLSKLSPVDQIVDNNNDENDQGKNNNNNILSKFDDNGNLENGPKVTLGRMEDTRVWSFSSASVCLTARLKCNF